MNYNDGVWRHLVWTITYSDNKTSTYTLYINGAKVWSSNNNYYPGDVARTKNYIGKSSWPDRYWNGCIDSFRCYQRVLTPDEVTELYNNRSNQSKILGFTTMQEDVSPVYINQYKVYPTLKNQNQYQSQNSYQPIQQDLPYSDYKNSNQLFTF
jgi:hypothetical protein